MKKNILNIRIALAVSVLFGNGVTNLNSQIIQNSTQQKNKEIQTVNSTRYKGFSICFDPGMGKFQNQIRKLSP
jgi:hypothetical protein